MTKWCLVFWAVLAIKGTRPTTASTKEVASRNMMENPPDCQEWSANNRLECWLWQLKIPIPNESFSADWITVSIEDMVCSQFALQNLLPTYDPSLPHSLDLSIRQIVARCEGKYHASGGISGKVQASVGEASSTTAALQVSLRLLPSTNYVVPRPSTFQTTSCQTQLMAKDIHFGGSASAKLIQAFSKTIGHYITQALQEELCPLLPKKLDPLVTGYLHQLDEWMKPYLPKQHHEQLHQRDVKFASSDHRRLGSSISNDDLSPNFISSSSFNNDSSNMNPLDWDSVRWTLTAMNTQISDHLQSPWIISANATRRYCPQQQQCQDLLRGISGLFRSIVGPALTIPLPTYFHNISLPTLPAPLDATISFGLEHISIKGLDRLNTLQIIRPDHNQSLTSKVATDSSLELKAPVSLHIQMPNTQHALDEPFIVKINITTLETLLETSTQISNWDNLTLLQVVNAIQRFSEDPTPSNIRPTLGCLIRTISLVDNLNWWTSMVLESISISRFPQQRKQFLDQVNNQNSSIASSLEEDLDHVINSVIELVLGEYTDLWTDLIHGLMQDPVRHRLNRFLADWLQHHAASEPSCPTETPSTHPKFLNFTKFIVLNHLNNFLNHRSTIHTMNLFLKCSGQLLEGYVAGLQASSLPQNESLFEFTGVETRHWNAIQRVQVLQPVDDTLLQSLVEWGSETMVPELQFNMRVTTTNISGSVNVTLFAGFYGEVETRFEYDLNRLENLTVAHLLQQIQCALVPTAELELFGGAHLAPMVGLNISALLNGQSIFFSTLEDHQGSTVAHEVAMAMHWTVNWIREIVNQALEGWTAHSSDMCPGLVPGPATPDPPDQDKTSSKWYNYPVIWIVLTAVVLAQGGIFNVMVRPREEAANQQLLNVSGEFVFDPSPLEDDIDDYVASIQDLDRALLSDIRNRNESVEDVATSLTFDDEPHFIGEGHVVESQPMVKPLFLTPHIPAWIRFVIPISTIGTIVLLVSSNLSVGASVDLSLRVGTTGSIPISGLFQFSLGNTISELYGAGIYPLLFLVLVFSGIWPYAKLIWMLYIWNTSYSDPHQRKQRLLTLDALSKFSLVDTYVLVVMLVAFRFHLDLSQSLGLDVYVTPEYGFYAFLLATCLSLLIGHGMLYFHRSTEHSRYTCYSESDVGLESASILSFAFVRTANGSKRRLSWLVQIVTVLSSLVALVCLLIGMSYESFSFDIGGLAGIALGEDHLTRYSVLSLGWAIRESIPDATRAVMCLQLAYYFYAVVTPLACLLLLLTLLVIPVPLQVQQNLVVAAEITHAWSAIEVFVLSIVAALFQLSTFASFLLGNRCDVLNGLMETLVDRGIVPVDHDGSLQCFSVTARIDFFDAGEGIDSWSSSSSSSFGSRYLILGVIMNACVAKWVLRLAHDCVQEREQRQEQQGSDDGDRMGREEVDHTNDDNNGMEGIVDSDNGEDNICIAQDNEDDETATPRPEWRFWF